MDVPKHSLASLGRIGGHPALDFVNTVRRWPPEAGDEYLPGFQELLDWNVRNGLVDAGSARALARAAPDSCADTHHKALELRAALHALFQAVAQDRTLPQSALDLLTETVKQTIGWRQLRATGSRLCCGWECCPSAPLSVLGPVSWGAMELLESGPLERVKECHPPEGCGWLFLDASKNRSRQWCNMRTCGNQAKVRRFRRRRAADGEA